MKKVKIGLLTILILIAISVVPVNAQTAYIRTNIKKSLVVAKCKQNYLNNKNKKSKKIVKRGQKIKIAYLRYGKQVYLANKNKQWLPSSKVYGKVVYQTSNNELMTLRISKKGRLSYSVSSSARTISLIVKHNAYVYNERGRLNKGTVVTIKKGTHVKGYSLHRIGKKIFYLTNKGYLKAANLIRNKKK